MAPWTIPNAITFLRLLAAPAFAALYWSNRPGAALVVFVAAGVSDSLDGFLARALHQQSRLGGLLDPVADKLLLAVALGSLAIAGPVPGWLFALVILREATLLAGAVAVWARGWKVPAAPTRLGKYATFLQIAAVLLALWMQVAGAPEAVGQWMRASTLLAAEMVIASAAQYAFRWAQLLRTRP